MHVSSQRVPKNFTLSIFLVLFLSYILIVSCGCSWSSAHAVNVNDLVDHHHHDDLDSDNTSEGTWPSGMISRQISESALPQNEESGSVRSVQSESSGRSPTRYGILRRR